MSGLFINLFAVEIQTGRQKTSSAVSPPPPPKKLFLSSTVDGDMNLKP